MEKVSICLRIAASVDPYFLQAIFASEGDKTSSWLSTICNEAAGARGTFTKESSADTRGLGFIFSSAVESVLKSIRNGSYF